MNWILRLLKGFIFVAFWGALILYLSQDIQIFPLALTRLGGGSEYNGLPPGVERIQHRSIDDTEIEVWRLPASEGPLSQYGLSALVLHGNGGDLENFFSMQRWMSSLGVTSYAFDYRGTGGSAGWPSEQGIFLDTLEVYELMRQRESLEPARTVVVGLSVGSGFAAGLAAKVAPGALVLFSPYRSITQMVRERRLLRLFLPLLRYSVPTEKYVERIDSSCLIVTHGAKDSIIPVSHSEELERRWVKGKQRYMLRIEDAGHNDLFRKAVHKVSEALFTCFSATAS